MLLSMTGFANKTVEITTPEGLKGYLYLTLKSLNTRFFEVYCKLPFAVQSLEPEIISRLKKQLYRGNITITFNVSDQAIFKSPIEPSMVTIKSYLKALKQIQDECKIKGDVTIADILQLPNVLITHEKSINSKTKNIILTAINEIIMDLITVRTKEGKALQKDIEHRCAIIKKEISSIESQAKKYMEAQKKRIIDQLKEIESQPEEFIQLRRNQLYNELDRADIHEEIIRFKTHLSNLTEHIQSPKVEKARRLDFMLQELGREVNTIAAKCGDATISSLAINIKVELEKIREQVQNIV